MNPKQASNTPHATPAPVVTAWAAAWAVAQKDLRLLLRDKSGFFFTFIFPIGFAVFFGLVFGGAGSGRDNRLSILVVDEDRTEPSAAFVSRLTQASELSVTTSPSVTAAQDHVLKRKALAFVRIPAGYAQQSRGLLWGQQTTLEVGVDPSRTAERGMLMGILQQHAFAGLADSFTNPTLAREQLAQARALMRDDRDVTIADRLLYEGVFASIDRLVDRGLTPQPPATPPANTTALADTKAPTTPAAPQGFAPVRITFTDVKPQRLGPANAFALTCPQGIIWGLMGAAMGFATSFVGERTGGTLARLRTSPMPATALLLGKALACLITTLAVTTLIITVGALLGVGLANWPTLALGVASVCLGFTGVMICVAAIAPTERAAAGVGWAIMMVLAFIGGAAVPTAFMPAWMQDVSKLSPMRWALQALEGGIWRGYAPTEPAMLTPVLVMIALALAGLALGVWSLRRAGA
jgi:ABC-2 type transport system permease protein